MILLSAAIGTSNSPLGPNSESDIVTDLYSDSTLISIKTILIVGSASDDFKKYTTSLQEMIKT
jgi:hypothetical protein